MEKPKVTLGVKYFLVILGYVLVGVSMWWATYVLGMHEDSITARSLYRGFKCHTLCPIIKCNTFAMHMMFMIPIVISALFLWWISLFRLKK